MSTNPRLNACEMVCDLMVGRRPWFLGSFPGTSVCLSEGRKASARSFVQ